MKPQNALIVVGAIVLLGEAVSDFLAEHGAWLTAVCLAIFSGTIIHVVKRANEDAK